jgi:hypothetical protein
MLRQQDIVHQKEFKDAVSFGDGRLIFILLMVYSVNYRAAINGIVKVYIKSLQVFV